MLVYEHSLHSLAARKMTNTPKCNNHSISVNTCVNKYASITALYVGFYGCILYADDIMLLSHSLNAMQLMLTICDDFANDYDLKFNTESL